MVNLPDDLYKDYTKQSKLTLTPFSSSAASLSSAPVPIVYKMNPALICQWINDFQSMNPALIDFCLENLVNVGIVESSYVTHAAVLITFQRNGFKTKKEENV